MVCLYCASSTQVTNSRLQKKLNQVWRRRRCLSCSTVYTTLEKIDYESALSVKSHNQYKPFSRDKLLLSIYDSLKHRKTALNDATALTDTVIAMLTQHISNACVGRGQIIDSTQLALKRFDKSAATYYAAYHPAVEVRS